MKLKPQTRFLQIESATPVNADTRTVTFPFSSEAPVKRWYGDEILVHDEKSADLGRLNDRAPLLFNHELNDVIGVVERAWVNPQDRRGYATVRFAKTQRGDEVLGMVQDGILPNVSFMYRINDAVENPKTNEIRVTHFEPLEISIVTVPADQSVGIGRAYANEEAEVRVTRIEAEEARPTRDESQPAPVATGAIMSEVATNPAAATVTEPEFKAQSPIAYEQARKAAILNLVRANKLDERIGNAWITNGATMEEVSKDILSILEERSKANPTATPAHLGMERKDVERYSVMRAIRASMNNDWSKAGLELEANKALAKRMNKIPRSDRAWFVPLDVMMRDMTVAGVSGSNYLVGTQNQAGNFIDLLRNTSVGLRMGVTRLAGLVGNVTIPKMTAGNTAYWLGDESTQITESQPTIGQLPLAPKNVAALTELSHQLISQSTPDAEQLVLSSIARDIALAVDVGILRGAGSGGEPQGIVGTSGVGSVTGTSLAAAGVIEFQTDVATANALMPGCGYVTTPAVAGLLMARPELPTTGTTRLWLGNMVEGSLFGLPALASAQMTAATMLFGHWPSVILAEWGVLELMTNPYSDFTRGLTAVRGWYTCDVGVRYPAAFSYAHTIT